MSTLTRYLNGVPETVRGYGRRVRIPKVGEVAVPPPDRIAYYAGLGLLATLQIIEWPLALAITAGHFLSDQHFSVLVKGVGEAFESA
ncbi:hypothetical protein ACIBPB_25580 [Micromonospora sp. NPDC049836]|uniref:hypothetical protein n=1 Tax=Micromonospora sp. NPDC049836 TaxID=3364274 RepID=UPI00378A5AB4